MQNLYGVALAPNTGPQCNQYNTRIARTVPLALRKLTLNVSAGCPIGAVGYGVSPYALLQPVLVRNSNTSARKLARWAKLNVY